LSNLLDQVEAKVVRAKRAFRRSTYIIAAARDELERHQRWLDRHRAAWAEDMKRYHRLLDRKISLRPFTRFAVSLILSMPSGLAQALRLKKRPPHASSQLSLSETTSDHARHSQLQHRIRGLDGQLSTVRPAVLRPIPEQIATRGECTLIADGGAFRAVASHGRFLKSKGLVSALGVITVFLIAAGAIRATISSPLADAQVSVAPKVPDPPQHAAALSVTMTTVPEESRKSAPSRAPASGFAVLAATSASEPLLLPAQSIANMMLITSPLALAPKEPEGRTAPVTGETLVAKPTVKAKPKRKMARREPQPLPWWQRWSWIRVR